MRALDSDARRGFGALLAATSVQHTGFGAVFPVLPLLVTGQGNSVGVIAVMAAAFVGSAFAFQYPMAAVADRFGRRRVLGIALLVNGGLAVLFAFHLGPVALVAVRFFQGLCTAAVEPSSRGLVSQMVPNEQRGQAYGMVASAEMVGIIGGPLLGGGIAAALPLEYVFLVQAVLCIIGGGGFLLLTRRLPARQDDEPASDGKGTSIRRLITADLIGLGLVAAGSSYLFGLYDTVWVLFMAKLGAGVAVIGASIALFGVPLFLVAPLAGRLGDRYGRVPPMLVGGIGVGLIAASYPLLPGLAAVIAVACVEGVMFALLQPNLYALIAAAAPEGMEARAQAAAGVMGTAGNLVAPLLAAFLWERDYHLAFYTGAGFVLLFTIAGGLLVLRPGNRVGGRRVNPELLAALAPEPHQAGRGD
ncbi:MAG: hypothetical protein QOE92_884 [Chloroflexota bacterium]|nr:hypothetical protein [Chloroflexota bacterium]